MESTYGRFFYLRRIWKGYRRQTTISFHYLQLGSLERKIKLYLMKAKSIKGKSLQEIESGLHQAMADELKPTLALVFMSVKQDREAITSLFNTEGIAVYGTTTNGEFIDETYEQGTIVVMLLDINA